MIEEFRARPSQIAGLGNAVSEIGRDNKRTADFVSANGPPRDSFSGEIIGTLLTPLTEFADATKSRMTEMADVNIWTSVELNKAAWVYHDREAKNYAALNAHTVHLGGDDYWSDPTAELHGITEGYGGAVAYPKPAEINLDPPAANKEDVAALISEASGWLGDVNEAVKNTTRMAGAEFDPLGTVLSPISGNWSELNRIGETHKIAGNAFEASAKNMDDGLSRVAEYWDGKAALAFDEFARKQSEGMAWEGPVGRTVALGLSVAADQIREGIKTVVAKLAEMLEAQVSIDGVWDTVKFWVKKVPVVGTTAQMAALGRIIWKVADLVLKLVDEIRELVNSVKEFLSVLTNPIGKAHTKLDEKLSPVTSKIDNVTRRAAIADDIGEISNFATAVRPEEAYELGSGKGPWADG